MEEAINYIFINLNNGNMKKRAKITMNIILMMTIGLLMTMQAKSQLNNADSLQMQFDSLDTKYFPSGILHNTSPYYWDKVLI
jgi:hypothetical protein